MRFILETLAAPPGEDALQSGLAALASARKEDQRLEPYILEMYRTRCENCSEYVSAREFLWEREGTAPIARVYSCPKCGEELESPVTPEDIRTAEKFSASPLHRAWALERVVRLQDPVRPNAEEALRAYPSRAINAIFTIINKLEGIRLNPVQQNHIAALLLYTFDRTNTLWPHPGGRARPKQLTIPPQYWERNVWLELEAAIKVWSQVPPNATPVTVWPESPRGNGGICIFEGRLRSLVHSLQEVDVKAVLTAIPRPNQAFWTLSALWGGWLWEREKMQTFQSVLRRQRYGWRWHTTALSAANQLLAVHLNPELPFFALQTEAEPGFLSATLLAGEQAGFRLDGLSMRPDDEQVQIRWTVARGSPRSGSTGGIPSGKDLVIDAARKYLQARGEPSPFLPFQGAVLEKWISSGISDASRSPANQYSQMDDLLHKAFTYRSGFLRFGGGQELDVGRWWLQDPGASASPLADRVEASVLEYLQRNPGTSLQEIDRAICTQYPGLFTPDYELLTTCVESYGAEDENATWSLRKEDEPDHRISEYENIRSMLMTLGKRLGFVVEGDTPLSWKSLRETYKFYITSSAALGEIVFNHKPVPRRTYIVLPGSRANLVLHKRQRDPRLDTVLEGWDFMKFRLLRQLQENPTLNQGNLEEQLRLDDLTYSSSQMKLL